ncbi:MAG: DUF4412 domain-containing protein, partial [bacterium]|nr:DUF4412 domain-containing protein [bacterium]
PEFSADMIMLHKNKVDEKGRFYMGKQAARMEMGEKKEPVIVFRIDQDVMWTIIDKDKTYMAMKMKYNALANYRPEGFSETCNGTETIDGHLCDKCLSVGKFMGKKVSTNIWKARDLNGAVIRNLDNKGTGSELKNIIKGPQPNSLFEAPAGYKKIELPGSLGDLMKGMMK